MSGDVAQLGERLNGIQEVRGSIPLVSTGYRSDCSVAIRDGIAGGQIDQYRVDYRPFAGIAQLVEHNLAKVGVAGSSPVSRSRLTVSRLGDASPDGLAGFFWRKTIQNRRGVEQSGSSPGS